MGISELRYIGQTTPFKLAETPKFLPRDSVWLSCLMSVLLQSEQTHCLVESDNNWLCYGLLAQSYENVGAAYGKTEETMWKQVSEVIIHGM